MYTETTRPNHLAHEVIDNSVDEAVAGHAKKIDVILHADGSLEVADDGDRAALAGDHRLASQHAGPGDVRHPASVGQVVDTRRQLRDGASHRSPR